MVKRTLLLLPCIGAVSAFMGQPLDLSRQHSSGTSSLRMGGATGYATSLAGKQARVATVKDLLDKSEMVISVPVSGITVAQVQTLRESLPEGTTLSCIKNKLMARAIEGTDYEAAAGLLKGANMWFFIEEDIGGTISAFDKFRKDFGKLESHNIYGGVIEGTEYDTAGVQAIGKLPSKDELYARIAGSIKAVPTKVARVIKAPNSKLARAIKLATMPEE